MKTVVITGATQGIGLSISQILHKNGHEIIGISRNNDKDFPGIHYQADLSDKTEREKIFSLIGKKHGNSLWGIINNVGICNPNSLESLTAQEFEKTFELNVSTALELTKALVPFLKEKEGGSIINISSITACGTKDRSSYAVSKASLEALTTTWALEFAPYNIRVNAVAPGPTQTVLFDTANPEGSKSRNKAIGKDCYNR